jgi:hypothetical protein
MATDRPRCFKQLYLIAHKVLYRTGLFYTLELSALARGCDICLVVLYENSSMANYNGHCESESIMALWFNDTTKHFDLLVEDLDEGVFATCVKGTRKGLRGGGHHHQHLAGAQAQQGHWEQHLVDKEQRSLERRTEERIAESIRLLDHEFDLAGAREPHHPLCSYGFRRGGEFLPPVQDGGCADFGGTDRDQ